ncbi:DUF3108 domain-containing protein [Brevundimonas sp.]
MLALMMATTLLTATGQEPVVPDGRRLEPYEACYTINMTRDGQTRPIGVTWQSLRRGEQDGRAIWTVVVHQKVGDRFDMRDVFTLDADTLRPLRLVNTRNGRTHVEALYAPGQIRVERMIGQPADATAEVSVVPLNGPVWDGNLYGPTFAALPLAEGGSYAVPFWQYDKGLGDFQVRIVGSETVETPEGPVEAWVLNVVANRMTSTDDPYEPAIPMTYRIAKSGGRELGYEAGPGSQSLGGDCSALQSTRP